MLRPLRDDADAGDHGVHPERREGDADGAEKGIQANWVNGAERLAKVIDSLGERIHELVLPVPKSLEKRKYITDMVQKVIEDRIEAREFARKARLEVLT